MFSGDYGGKDVVAISLHRMALAYVSLRKRGAGIQTTCSSRGGIDHKERIRSYGRSLQVRTLVLRLFTRPRRSRANEIINLFVCDTKRRWRTIGGIFSDRREHGARRGGGRVRRVWLLEKAKAEQERAHRKFGTTHSN